MNKTSIAHWYQRSLTKILPLLSLLALYSPSFADSTTLVPLNHLRIQLNVRLDSLEMEKQNLKRSGTDITSLERHCRLVKDSLAQLRTLMQKGSKTIATHLPAPVASRPLWFNLRTPLNFRPADLFDWILLGTAAVALLSGLMLLIALFGSLMRKKKRAPRLRATQPVPPQAPRHASVKKPPIHTPPPETPLPLEHIDTLRKRMQQQPPPTPTQQLSPAVTPPPLGAARPVKLPGDTHQRVLSAAQQGLSPAEIAKALQLSVDHVMLILRVAKTGRS